MKLVSNGDNNDDKFQSVLTQNYQMASEGLEYNAYGHFMLLLFGEEQHEHTSNFRKPHGFKTT